MCSISLYADKENSRIIDSIRAAIPKSTIYTIAAFSPPSCIISPNVNVASDIGDWLHGTVADEIMIRASFPAPSRDYWPPRVLTRCMLATSEK